MDKTKRQTDIMDILQDKTSVTVNYLASRIYASPSTIRRDLANLEAEGYVRRFHGGASISNRPTAELPIWYRLRDMAEAKQKIGYTASGLIQSGNTIFIDSSSTAAAIIPYLGKFSDLRIITNSLVSLQELQNMPFEVYCVGGHLFRNSSAFVGQLAANMLSHFHIDKMFFSTASLAADGILCSNTEEEHFLRLCALEHSDQSYLMIDSSKVGVSSVLKLCHINDITGVVSDAELPELIEWNDGHPDFYLAGTL